MCLLACLKWSCLNLPNKYFIDIKISTIELTVSPSLFSPFPMCLGVCIYIYVLFPLNFPMNWVSPSRISSSAVPISSDGLQCKSLGLVTHSTITMVTKWRHVHSTSSAKDFFTPALRTDATANRSKGVAEKAEEFTEIKMQLELILYSFPTHTSSESSSLLLQPLLTIFSWFSFFRGLGRENH